MNREEDIHRNASYDEINHERRAAQRGWLILGVAVLLIAPASLGVHEFMLESLHVPYPRPVGLPAWTSYLNEALSAYALIVLCRESEENLKKLCWRSRCFFVTALVLMLHETVRVLCIDIALTHAWIFQSVRALPQIASYLVFCSTVVVISPRLNSAKWRIGVAAIVAAVLHFAVVPTVGRVFAPFLGSVARLDYPQLYFEPFPKRIFVPIYAGFIEPVIASFLVAALVRPSATRERGHEALHFVLLIMALKGSLMPTVLWSFWIPGSRLEAVLSEAQFGLEILVMALLTILVWQSVRRRCVLRQL